VLGGKPPGCELARVRAVGVHDVDGLLLDPTAALSDSNERDQAASGLPPRFDVEASQWGASNGCAFVPSALMTHKRVEKPGKFGSVAE
jgi:hypothetical protein